MNVRTTIAAITSNDASSQANSLAQKLLVSAVAIGYQQGVR
jgi:hypothetical protein